MRWRDPMTRRSRVAVASNSPVSAEPVVDPLVAVAERMALRRRMAAVELSGLGRSAAADRSVPERSAASERFGAFCAADCLAAERAAVTGCSAPGRSVAVEPSAVERSVAAAYAAAVTLFATAE